MVGICVIGDFVIVNVYVDEVGVVLSEIFN